jgi:hypothetical protein
MTKSNGLRLPFHVGQTADSVVQVVKRTGRTRRVLVIIDAKGEHRLEFERHERKSETKRWMEETVEMKSIMCVTEVYDDCTLVFKLSRGVDKKGALCFRIAEILSPGTDHERDDDSNADPILDHADSTWIDEDGKEHAISLAHPIR